MQKINERVNIMRLGKDIPSRVQTRSLVGNWVKPSKLLSFTLFDFDFDFFYFYVGLLQQRVMRREQRDVSCS